MWHMDIDEFEEKISENNCLQVEKSLRYLSEMTLRVWDYGLRPFSVPLINMANKLSVEDRLSVKKEWVAASVKLAEPLLENEERVGEVDGGYNLVVLKNNV